MRMMEGGSRLQRGARPTNTYAFQGLQVRARWQRGHSRGVKPIPERVVMTDIELLAGERAANDSVHVPRLIVVESFSDGGETLASLDGDAVTLREAAEGGEQPLCARA